MLTNMKQVFLVMLIGTFGILFPNSKTPCYVHTTKSVILLISMPPSLIPGTQHPIKYAYGFVVLFRCGRAASILRSCKMHLRILVTNALLAISQFAIDVILWDVDKIGPHLIITNHKGANNEQGPDSI